MIFYLITGYLSLISICVFYHPGLTIIESESRLQDNMSVQEVKGDYYSDTVAAVLLTKKDKTIRDLNIRVKLNKLNKDRESHATPGEVNIGMHIGYNTDHPERGLSDFWNIVNMRKEHPTLTHRVLRGALKLIY